MKRQSWLLGLSALTTGLVASSALHAAPTLRFQVDQNGDFTAFGNTLAHDCDGGLPAPVVGNVGACGGSTGDSAVDIFWRSNAAGNNAVANTGVTNAQARSVAVLQLPAGATVTYARIYWAGFVQGNNPDNDVRIERVSAGLDTVVNADDTFSQQSGGSGDFWYQSTAEITSLVLAQGPGDYRVSGVDTLDLGNLNDPDPVTAWSVVVFYDLPTDPPRNLALFDGLDEVSDGNPQSATLSGFLVPNAGFDAKLGVLTYEGDSTLTGDSLLFNATQLSDGVNPADNFFNRSRSFLGNPVSVAGDLPQLTGDSGSMGGFDLDVVDVTSLVSAGETSASIEATSSGDRYLLGAFVTSISTFKPEFDTSVKNVLDLNGGSIRPGDEIEYTVNVVNTGNDDSTNTVLTDALPAGVTYVAGTLEITMGANPGVKTDMSGDDQGEYDTGTRTLTVRLGAGANQTNGGTMLVGETAVIKFRVTVDANASGTISNQAIINAGGVLGAPPEDTPTDGNGPGPGQPPTDVDIDECDTDADCSAPTPICDTAQSPQVCVECSTSSQCTDPMVPDCNPTSNTCECASGPGTCMDTDGDGISDGAETTLGTDPNDADSDDDGTPDGQEPAPGDDTDGDGLINALDPDSDNDGLFDGTELGLDCSNPDTDRSLGHCRSDADAGATTTDPLDADTDDGGASDGSEDSNLDGAVDAGETNPTSGNGPDDTNVVDSDGDGLSDATETFLHSNPNDADTDDDGVRDGDEANPSDDTDGDGLINVLDVDSDDDALFDGTETGRRCDDPATDTSVGHCRADNDGGTTTTSPVDPDSDDGGVTDGSEDANLNGIVDSGETDPTAGNGADDSTVVDSDGDGLSDGLEGTLGSNPNDADTDDDGVRDGDEANPSDDTDGDGNNNVSDEDSDGDGLFDGTEVGNDCSDPATDNSLMTCVADGDAGATTTSPVNPDTDFGSKPDGGEDTNRDGVRDPGESDPNDPRDDRLGEPCGDDAECGALDSGVVCDNGTCVEGCRGTGGNGCPTGEECSSMTMTVGTCGPPVGTGGTGGTGGMGGAATGGTGAVGAMGGTGATGAAAGAGGLGAIGDNILEGGGCACTAPGDGSQAPRPLALALMALGLLVLRRRR